MRKIKNNNKNSQYLSRTGTFKTHKSRMSRFKVSLMAILSVFLISLFAGTAVTAGVTGTGTIAHADYDEDAQKKIQDSAKDYIADGKTDDEKFFNTLQKADSEESKKNDFGSVIRRVLGTEYLNDTSKGTASKGKINPKQNCNVNAPGNGTLNYHNCDVPNLMTELLQDMISLITPNSISGADTESAQVSWGLGIPKNLPGGGAPVNTSDRNAKYTGLELFGYNLRYTIYNGEWDHIKVMTSARALANFGWMDNIKMSVNTVFEGINSGFERGTENFANNISTGNIIGAIGGFFSGFFEGGISGGINSIIDTSDLNIFNTYGWYRVGFSETLYNARELSDTEIAARAKAEMLNMITSDLPETATTPDDLKAVASGPPDPKQAIAKCTIVNANNAKVEWGSTSSAPGPSEADCKRQAQSAYDARQQGENPPNNDKVNYTWKEDGTQKKETISEWKKNHANYFDAAQKYQIQCDIETDAQLASFKACWPQQYTEAVNQDLDATQDRLKEKWADQKLDPKTFQKWVNENPARNFNAPWNRYVCSNNNGKDKRVDGKLVMLYNYKGELNKECKSVRPPIQDGWFGNGYLNNQTQPAVDTRSAIIDRSMTNVFFPMKDFSNQLANLGLKIASFVTQVSNEVISISFEPITESLGLNKLVIKIIKEFRDSIFFPFVALLVAIAGISSLMSAGRRKDYRNQIRSMLLLAGTIMLGVFMMFRPELVLKAVDTIPAQAEQAVIGSIFSAGATEDEDKLCSSSGTAYSKGLKGLDGKRLEFNPSNSTRTLMCENWRAFALNPWVFGQFGTDYSNLNNARMTNTNGDLIGKGNVAMGNGISTNNWALYQLDKMSSGTASFKDNFVTNGSVDKNLYKVVDLQAGPDNAKASDTRYFEDWSGSNYMNRLMIGSLSGIMALFGFVTVVVYSFTKIVITCTIVIMLLILPIMFLLGIHPTKGRLKLKSYVGTILSLMVQRVVLVLLMAVMFRVVIGFSGASGNFFINFVAAIVSCIVFLRIRKQILGAIMNQVTSKMGQNIGGAFTSDPSKWAKDKAIKPGGYVSNKLAVVRTGATAIATGGIAGFVSGGFEGMKHSIKETQKVEIQKLKNIQRRRGFRGLQLVTEGYKSGKDSVISETLKDDQTKVFLRDHAQELYSDIDALEKQEWDDANDAEVKTYIDTDGEAINYKETSNGKIVLEPMASRLASFESQKDISAASIRRLRKIIESKRKLAESRGKTQGEYYNNEDARTRYEKNSRLFESDKGNMNNVIDQNNYQETWDEYRDSNHNFDKIEEESLESNIELLNELEAKRNKRKREMRDRIQRDIQEARDRMSGGSDT